MAGANPGHFAALSGHASNAMRRPRRRAGFCSCVFWNELFEITGCFCVFWNELFEITGCYCGSIIFLTILLGRPISTPCSMS